MKINFTTQYKTLEEVISFAGEPEAELFTLAEQFALHTNQNIFLTGKAGTGKTTLLRKIANRAVKNFVVVAPTGVAAINAGGVTIHSMFQLPISSFIPSNDFVDANIAMNQRLLLSHMRMSKEKRLVIQEMELLIIDEVSMVRCDILDAVDFVLRVIRRSKEPFGGVQVLLIGDMHQLPPVVRDHEWNILKNYYQSPYFFDSHVWKKTDAVQIELKKIFRQQDESFLRLLNNIRNKEMMEQDYELLHKRFQPGFKPTEEGYVLLSSHNRIADEVNERELRRLPGKIFSYKAEVGGDFPENNFPCEHTLQLKVGAQVMFIRNDPGGKYYNGKLAKITKLDEEEIRVSFNDTKENFTLHREEWESVSYSTNAETEQVEKRVQGTFSQYPLRLAWAITIHKSQGLTFDKVIIDAGASFAAGQVYVALSRCRTLEGIVLHSRISQSVLFTDEKINQFSSSHHNSNELENILSDAKKRFANAQLKKLFAFGKLADRLDEWKELIQAKEIPEKEIAMELNATIRKEAEAIMETSGKFHQQLEWLLNEFEKDEGKLTQLKERIAKAIEYFSKEIFEKLITPLHEHVQLLAYKARVKKYVQNLQVIEDLFWNKINQLYSATFREEKLFSGEVKFSKQSLKKVESSITSGKKEKGGTYKDTLDLHKQGKTILEIAIIRSLSTGTIKSHIAKWIGTGEINIGDVLSADKILTLTKAIVQHGSENYPALKKSLGSDFDYSEIKMVINAKIYNTKKSTSDKALAD